MHQNYDELLQIYTANTPVAVEKAPVYNHYEATPYPILYTLFQTYRLSPSDRFVDFGCGKGRVLFYAHYLFDCEVIGIEMNSRLLARAKRNKYSYIKSNKNINEQITLKHKLAESYLIRDDDNVFYFFNPFSLDILKIVITRILTSIEQAKRSVDLIFYFPKNEFIHYLTDKTPFTFYQEIKIPGLSKRNYHERFVIFRYSSFS